MREVSYVLRFERTKTGEPTVATGLVTSSTIKDAAVPVTTTRKPARGSASYDSVFVLEEDGIRFTESGIVKFHGEPDLHTLAFSTLGYGYLVPPADPVTKLTPGAVVWKIDAGTGFFEGATGVITSNFRVNPGSGQLIDDHTAIVFLPD